MFENKVPYRVLLPNWVFDATDKEHFKRNLASYMRWYPNYIVKRIDKPFVYCERKD
jgi:hypothetical protein